MFSRVFFRCIYLKITRDSNCVDGMAGKRWNVESWYHAMIENSHHGIILFDKTGFTIRETNAAFSKLLHYKPEELVGMVFTSLFINDEERTRFLTRFGQSPEIARFETRFKTKEGNECRVELSSNAVDTTTISCSTITINPREKSTIGVDDDFAHYNWLTENLPTSILIVRDGKIQYANPAFFSFSGYQPDEIPGIDVLSLVDNSDKDQVKEFVKRGLEGAFKADRNEFRFVTKSGEKRMALLFTLPVIHSGSPAILVNMVDISEKQLLEDKIRLDNERRRGIIVTVAHELRTPLQPILGYLNLLIQDPEGFGIPEDTRKILERCLASVDRERQIINQMLELSVLDSGKLHLNYSKFPLVLLTNSVLDSSGYNAKAEITIDIPKNLVIKADMDRLFGVIDSLLSNAVNFSQPPRKIAIFYHSDTGDRFHNISVRDNGTGISENALSSIFEPFQLADAAKLSRRYDRIGLSLSMAKKIMQMHGGDISVESRLHTGSTFTLHLPKSD
jgi:PAS domain S-box-containing protein